MIRKVFKDVFKNKRVRRIKEDNSSYDKKYKVEKLYLSLVIVNRYQGDYFIHEFLEIGASSSFLLYGKGTAPSEFLYMLGVEGDKKDIVLTVIKESLIEKIDKIIDNRFLISKSAKGISFIIEFDSIMGVLPYRFFSDTKINEKINKK